MLAGLPADVAVAATAYVGTNVDDAIVTMAMIASSPHERSSRIAAGQVIGFVLLVAASAAMAIALFELSHRLIGLFGLVPLALGIRGLTMLARHQPRKSPADRAAGSGVMAAALVTIASGGDNLAVYIPLFRVSGAVGLGAIAVVFAVGELLLLLLALRAGRHPRARLAFGRIGAWVTPVLYCAIGILVLVQAGTLPT